jgi:hypothetical protein
MFLDKDFAKFEKICIKFQDESSSANKNWFELNEKWKPYSQSANLQESEENSVNEIFD